MSGAATPPWEVPSHWTVTTMGDACQVVGGSTPKAKEPKYWGGDIQWLGVSDLTGYTGKWIAGGARSLTQEGYDSCSTTLMPRGAVLFSSRAPIGYVAIAAGPICTSQGFKSFVPPEGVEPEFLYWYLRALTPFARGRASGTTFPELSTKAAKALPLVIPPLDEQRAIVAAIEDAFTRIDAIEDELAPIHRSRELFRVAVLRDAMRGALLSSGRVASAEGPGAGEPGLPSGWVWRELSSVSENLDRKRVPVNAKERADRLGDVPYYGATGRVGWIDEPLFDEDLVLLGEDGVSFLDPKVTKAYRVSGKSWVNNHAHVLRPNRSVVTDAFLCFALNQIDYSGRVSGTTRLKLTQKDMNSLRLPIPPLDEQMAIVAEIEDALGRVEELDRLASEVEASLDALRASVLHRAFTGDLLETLASEKESVAV